MATLKKVKAEAASESSESEEEESQESDQEVTDEKLTKPFDKLKASVEPQEKPPAASAKTAGLTAQVEETGSQPARSHSDIASKGKCLRS